LVPAAMEQQRAGRPASPNDIRLRLSRSKTHLAKRQTNIVSFSSDNIKGNCSLSFPAPKHKHFRRGKSTLYLLAMKNKN